MKKINLLLFLLGYIACIQSQVGINTSHPLGIFHIDPKQDTGGTIAAPTNDTDDLIVTSDGYVGIGTANPQTNLHIVDRVNPPLRIEDGNQGLFKVLTAADASGNAEWRDQLLFKGQAMNGDGQLIKPVPAASDIPLVPPYNVNDPTTYRYQGIGQIIGNTVMLKDFKFTPPSNGLYSFEVRFWGRILGSDIGKGVTAFHIQLANCPNANSPTSPLAGMILLDEYEAYAITNKTPTGSTPYADNMTFFVTLYANIKGVTPTNKPDIRLTGRVGGSPGGLGIGLLSSGNVPWVYTKVVIRLIGESL